MYTCTDRYRSFALLLYILDSSGDDDGGWKKKKILAFLSFSFGRMQLLPKLYEKHINTRKNKPRKIKVH
jgi:hypothetical protein